jgi:hypothetical protein
MSAMPATPFQAAADQVYTLGQTLRRVPGGYVVNFRNSGASTEYQTEDLADALGHARAVAAHAPQPPLPPLGPTGSQTTRRGQMYKHNRKLAARRRRQAGRNSS